MERLASRLASLETALGDLKALSAAYKPHPSQQLPGQTPVVPGTNNVLPKVFTSKFLVTPGKGDGKDDKTPAGAAAGSAASASGISITGGGAADGKSGDSKDGAAADASATAAAAAAAATAKGGKVAAPPNSVVSEVAELHAQWKRIEEKTFTAFFQKYNDMQSVLESDVDMKSLLLSNGQKQSLLLSGSREYTQTAKLLEALQSLVGAIDKVPLQSVSAVIRRLSQAAALVDARHSAVAALHAEIDQFVDLYNGVIELLSRKFVQIDAQLSEWEQRVDAAITKHAPQLAAIGVPANATASATSTPAAAAPGDSKAKSKKR